LLFSAFKLQATGAFCFKRPKQCTIPIWFTHGKQASPVVAFTGQLQCSGAYQVFAACTHFARSGELRDLAPLMTAALSAQAGASTGWHLSVFIGHAVWSSQQVIL
jgi:hypothetical protein